MYKNEESAMKWLPYTVTMDVILILLQFAFSKVFWVLVHRERDTKQIVL